MGAEEVIGRNSAMEVRATPTTWYETRSAAGVSPIRWLGYALLSHKTAAVVSVLLGLLAGWLVKEWLPERYRAESMIMLEEQLPRRISSADALVGPTPTASEPAIVRSEVQILENDSLIGDVIDKLNLDNLVDAHPVRQRIFRSIDGWLEAITGTLDATGIGALEAAAKSVDAWRGRTFDQASLLALTPLRRDKLVAWYKKRLSVKNDDKTLVLTVSFVADTAELATQISATHVDLYLAHQRQRKAQMIEDAARWLTDRVDILREAITKEEATIQLFRQNNGLAAPGSSTLVAQRLIALNTQLALATSIRIQQEARLSRFKRGLSTPDGVDSETEVLASPSIQRLKEQRTELQRSITALKQKYAGQFPGVGSLRAQLADITNALGTETAKVLANVQEQVDLARVRETRLSEQVNEVKNGANQEEWLSLKLHDLERQLEVDKTMYSNMVLRRSQFEADPIRWEADAWLVSAAWAPLSPLFPAGNIITAAGGLTGLLLLTCWFAARDVFSTRIRDIDDLADKGALSPLGIFPKVTQGSGGGRVSEYTVNKPGSMHTHEINRIRHGLSLALGTAKGRTILVTSALPGEGKSVLSLALARSFATDGQKTLLLEMDFCHPMLKQTLEFDGEAGTQAALARTRNLAECLYTDRRSSLNIVMAESAIAADSGFMTSANIHALLAEAREMFDVVVMDTTSIAAAPDSLALCRYADAAVLAVRCDVTPADLVRATGQHLLTAGVGLVGAVLVGYDPAKSRYAPHHYAFFWRGSNQGYTRNPGSLG